MIYEDRHKSVDRLRDRQAFARNSDNNFPQCLTGRVDKEQVQRKRVQEDKKHIQEKFGDEMVKLY
jgi:hypothetical protein